MRLCAIGVLAATVAWGQVPLGQGQVLILVGPPGSGKTVQAGMLSKKYKVPAVSVASVVTDYMKISGGGDKSMQASLAGGEFLDDQTAIRLVGARIGQRDAIRGFILDGFPATEAQAKHLERFIAENKLSAPIVLILTAPDDVIRQRLKKRGRADDTPANIDRRITEFHQERAFLESWYKTQNSVTADSTGTPVQVFANVEKALDEVFARRKLKAR